MSHTAPADHSSDLELELALPRPERSTTVVAPPGDGPGHWAGAPSAAWDGNHIYLAYRLRRPPGMGRGYAVVVARSTDGEHFDTLSILNKDQFESESLERPALVRTPDGRWRLYVSCATPGTKHWRVELIEANEPAGFDARRRRVVLPGDARTAVKDPAVRFDEGLWHLWASCHPLDDPEQADQMVTCYATSQDGLDWTWRGTALRGRPGQWDSRAARVTSIWRAHGTMVALYDGRGSAAENCEEVTGVATGRRPAALTARGSAPLAVAPYGALRYVDVLPLPGGRRRLYYEISRADRSHELRTELVPPGR